MNERMRHAMASMAVVTERASYLTLDEQETLALKLEAFAESLHWEQWFHLPESFMADEAVADARRVAAVSVQPPSQHREPSAVSTGGTASTRTPFVRAASGSPSTARGGDAPDA